MYNLEVIKISNEKMSELLFPTPQQRMIFDNLTNGVYFVDKNRNITYWNAAAEQITGYSADEVVGQSCRDNILVHSDNNEILCDAGCPLLKSMEAFKPLSLTVNMRHKDGYRLPIQVSCVPLLDKDNKLVGAVEIFEPVDMHKDINSQLKELWHIAYLDALMDIPNRRYIEGAVEDWLQAYRQRGSHFAIAMTDIDFFKNINDQYTHDAGDVVLKGVANVMQENLRSVDIVGRWGGDEFIIMLQRIPTNKLEEKFEQLRSSIEDSVFHYEGHKIQITMSFGYTVPRETDTAASLFVRADELLYKSKREGRNRASSDIQFDVMV